MSKDSDVLNVLFTPLLNDAMLRRQGNARAKGYCLRSQFSSSQQHKIMLNMNMLDMSPGEELEEGAPSWRFATAECVQ
eukprot:1653767-Amphidinium_carterae.2